MRSGTIVIAETDRALELQEAAYPPVLYVPLDDVDRRLCAEQRPAHLVPVQGRGLLLRHRWRRDGTDLTAAVWYYDDPFPAVADIEGHVAFYADRVAITTSPSDPIVR